MRVLGIIPARGGSKGIPGKNIRLLNGKPLLAYTFEAAKKAKNITRLVLNTDDEEIARVGMQLGLVLPFLRPSELAQDNTPTLPVVQHMIAELEKENEYFDAVCLLQTTSPFRAEGMIDAAIEKFIQSGADSLVSVQLVPHEYNPHWVFEPNEEGMLKIATGESEIIGRRQDLPEAFIRDGALYITRTEVLKQGSLYGDTTAYYLHTPPFHVNLDTENDWKEAERLLCAE